MLKGAAVRNPWKRVYVVNTSLLPSVTAQHDSILMYDTSEAIGTTGHWDVTFLIGVNSLSAAAARANVAVLRPFRNGGRDNEWSQNIAITSKTADNKFYICKILDLTPGREYRFRLGLDVNNVSNTILSSTEFVRNRFYSVAYDVFEFSLKHNGQAVPKTTDYGTPTTPIDTGTTVVPVDSTKPTLVGQFGDTSLTDWVIRKEYVADSDAYTFYFNYKVTTKPLGQVASPAFVIANLNPTVNGGKESLTMMTGDSIAYFTVPVSSFPAEGLRMYQYGRGTAFRDFEGSMYAMPDNSLWLVTSVAVLNKRAAF